MRGFSEMPSHPQENAPSKKEESFLSKVKKSPMAKAAMVAAGLHVAVPVGIEATRIGVAHARTEQERWHGENSVLRVQSDAVRDAVASKIQEREKHQDVEKLKVSQEKAAERLAKGEPVGFEELYFQQAEAKGVPHERIEQAKKIVQGLVEHFASKLEGGLSDEEIKDISREMFDLAEYEWGQGSVVDYFLDHKRNCVAVAQAETIVFDRLVERLPEDQRGRFHLGRRYEDQHQIAVMGVSSSVKTDAERFIILQPPYHTEFGSSPPAGTAMVSDTQLKKALVGKTVKASAVAAQRGEKMESGPRIDAIVNQPVDEGIVIEGKLRVANENIREAKKEGVEPMTRQEYEKKFGGMEIEIQFEDANTELKKRARVAEQKVKPHEYVTQVELQDIAAPTKALDFGWKDVSKADRVELILGTLDAWSPEALESLAAQQVGTISLKVDENGRLPSALIKAFQDVYGSQIVPGMPWRMLELRKSIEAGAKNIDDRQFAELLSTTLASEAEIQKDSSLRYANYELKLTMDTITDAQFETLKKFPPRAVHIGFRMEHLWTSADSSPGHVERDRLRKGLKALGVPVYIDLGLLGAPMPIMPDPPKEDFDWMFNDGDRVYPEFSDLVSAAIEPKSMNHFPGALDDHLPQSSKATFLESFVEQLRIPEVGRPVDHEDILQSYFKWCQSTLQ